MCSNTRFNADIADKPQKQVKRMLYGHPHRGALGGKNEKNNFTIDFNNFVIRRRKKR